MRRSLGVLAVALGLAVSGTAVAQPQLVQRVGDRWVFAISASALVDRSFVGQKVYFPITAARNVGVAVLIGEAAICHGRYSGKVPDGLGSVEGRVTRLELSSARFKNTRGQEYRRATQVFALTGCKFGPADMNAIPKEMIADEQAEREREKAQMESDIEDVLRQEREACLKILAERNIPADPQSMRTYCPD